MVGLVRPGRLSWCNWQFFHFPHLQCTHQNHNAMIDRVLKIDLWNRMFDLRSAYSIRGNRNKDRLSAWRSFLIRVVMMMLVGKAWPELLVHNSVLEFAYLLDPFPVIELMSGTDLGRPLDKAEEVGSWKETCCCLGFDVNNSIRIISNEYD